jgi:hypothetical protein
MKEEESDWVLTRDTYRLILIPVWTKMMVGVRANKIPVEQQLQHIH